MPRAAPGQTAGVDESSDEAVDRGADGRRDEPAEGPAPEQAPEPVLVPAARRRWLKDGLVGAGVAVLVMVLVVVVLFLLVTRPASDEAAVAPSPGATAGPTGPPGEVPPTPGEPADSPPATLARGDLWLTGLSMDATTLATPDGVLHDVVVTGQDVRTGTSGLVAGVLGVEATVPFELVATQIGGDVTVRPVPGRGDTAAVHRSFEAFGRVLDVEATGTVSVVSGLLVIEPRTIDIGGPAFLADLLGSVARELVTIEHEIEGIPEGLVLLDVVVQDDGFRAQLGGRDVRIEP